MASCQWCGKDVDIDPEAGDIFSVIDEQLVCGDCLSEWGYDLLKGQKFQEARDCGYVTYKIVGGLEEWKSNRDAEKRCGFRRPDGRWDFSYNSRVGFCLAVVEVGDYNGSTPTTLRNLLDLLPEEIKRVTLTEFPPDQ